MHVNIIPIFLYLESLDNVCENEPIKSFVHKGLSGVNVHWQGYWLYTHGRKKREAQQASPLIMSAKSIISFRLPFGLK